MITKRFAVLGATLGLGAGSLLGTDVSAFKPPADDVEDVLASIDSEVSADLCASLPGLVFDVYLSPAFLVGEEDIATDMVVAWLVEMFEEGYGSNLSEEAEVVLVEYLTECAGAL